MTRKGKAVAAMVPIEDLDAIQKMEDQKDVVEAERVLYGSEKEFIPWDQAKRELTGD